MKVSNKLRKQILNALSSAFFETLKASDEYKHLINEPPEEWNNEEKRVYDLLDEFERNASQNIEKVIA